MFWEMRLENLAARLSLHDIPVRIALWNGQRFDLGRSIKVMIHARTPAGLRHLVRPSLDALGSAYVEGHLDVEGELGDVFEVAAGLARHAVKPTGRFGRLVHTIKHTKRLDADAIAYHYDVSNDFYRAWLDENMVYSCAYFKSLDDNLEQAQRQKIDHVLTKIRLQSGQHLLDIGCGWGALIMRMTPPFGIGFAQTGFCQLQTQ